MQNSGSSQSIADASPPDGRASEQMKRGLRFLGENTPDSLREAAQCFEEAIRLRGQLPLADAWVRYGLIAAWMNRGDALTRLGSPDDLDQALRDYDEALIHLRELPMAESPLFVRRLAIAWLNRGVTLLTQATPDSFSQAAPCFDEAVAAAKNFFVKDPGEGRVLLASAWMNRAAAGMRLRPPQALLARESAKAAIELCAACERENAAAGEIGLQARNLLCQAVSRLLPEMESGCEESDALLTEAIDAVDEGMALARHWESRDTGRFRTQAKELFKFGCRLYPIYQPHFLTEFLLENMEQKSFGEDMNLHMSAIEALRRTLADIQHGGFTELNTPRFDQTLDHLRELRIAEERLTELRRLHATNSGKGSP